MTSAKNIGLLVLALLPGCAAAPILTPEAMLASAEEKLQGWKERWAKLSKPAEGEDLARAEEAREILQEIESEHASQAPRERLSLRLAESCFATGRLAKAFAGFRAHLENYPVTENRKDVEKYIYQLGYRWSLMSGSFLGTGIASDEGRALDALKYLVDYAPHSSYADDALRLTGEIELRRGDYSDAIASFGRILHGHPESAWVDLAQFRIAEAFLRRVADPRADRGALIEAEARFRDYLARRAEGNFRKQAEAGLAEAIEKLAQSEFEIGEFYRKIGKDYAARFHFSEAVKKYSGTRFAASAEQALASLAPETAKEEKKTIP